MIPSVQTAETGDENATLLVCDRMRCFGKKVLAIHLAYKEIDHFPKGSVLELYS